jgi:hypothetical protein
MSEGGGGVEAVTSSRSAKHRSKAAFILLKRAKGPSAECCVSRNNNPNTNSVMSNQKVTKIPYGEYPGQKPPDVELTDQSGSGNLA